MEIIQKYRTSDGVEWDNIEIADIRQKIIDATIKFNLQAQEYNKVLGLCTHEKITIKNKSNTGNWCSSDDRYWSECKCLVCGKFWTEDQDEIYDKYIRTGKGIKI